MNPDFPHSRTDRRNWLPVRGIEALLDTAKLEAGVTARIRRECPNIAAARTEPVDRFLLDNYIYKFLYLRSSSK